MRTNVVSEAEKPKTHEGGVAERQRPEIELERAVATCLLWEDTFYEKGNAIAERIAELCQRVDPSVTASLAVKARTKYVLRHVPLWLCVQLLARRTADGLAARTIESVIQRPDELGELVSIYWRGGKRPLAKQLKLGLARAFQKFDEYRFAK